MNNFQEDTGESIISMLQELNDRLERKLSKKVNTVLGIKRALSPDNNITMTGNLSYDEGSRAFAVLRLKRDVITRFCQLKERNCKHKYRLIYLQDIENLRNLVSRLEKDDPLPLLLWFVNEKEPVSK